MNNTTTRRTATPETHIRNLRNRQAQLIQRNLLRTITPEEQKELNALSAKLREIENTMTGASQ